MKIINWFQCFRLLFFHFWANFQQPTGFSFRVNLKKTIKLNKKHV